MPAKDRAKRRATWNAWYHRTKHLRDDVARRTAVKRARKQRLAAWLVELKRQRACRDCGQDHPACLVFHHTSPSTKELALADAIRRGFSRERIRREIEKCVVLCANCHIKLHARERADGT
jgi:hypothetical protein